MLQGQILDSHGDGSRVAEGADSRGPNPGAPLTTQKSNLFGFRGGIISLYMLKSRHKIWVLGVAPDQILVPTKDSIPFLGGWVAPGPPGSSPAAATRVVLSAETRPCPNASRPTVLLPVEGGVEFLFLTRGRAESELPVPVDIISG